MPEGQDYRDWSCIVSLVVDNLVIYLKRTRRWKHEGPVLRLLNKQWSQTVNQYVLEVRPHHSRKILDKDILSLLKFPHLTSVDVTPFLESYRIANATAANLTTRVDSCVMHLKKVIDVLVQFPRLSHVEVGLYILTDSDLRAKRTRDQWSRLSSITSLYVYKSCNPKNFGISFLNTVSICDEISGPETDLSNPKTLFGMFPNLKNLELCGLTPAKKTNVGWLEKLDSVKLQSVRSFKEIRSPSLESFIASATLNELNRSEIEVLAKLERLETLRLVTNRAWVLFDDLFLHHLGRLRVLDLENRTGSHLPVPEAFFASMSCLECLNLCHVAFDGKQLKGKLMGLKSLRLRYCHLVDGDFSFLSQLSKLEAFCWRKTSAVARVGMDLCSFFATAVPRIRSLSTRVRPADRPFTFITNLTELEVLAVDLPRKTTSVGVHDLEKLSKLRFLHVSYSIKHYNAYVFATLLSLTLIARLEQLWLSVPRAAQPLVNSFLREIDRKARRLIVHVKYDSGLSVGRKIFENAHFI